MPVSICSWNYEIRGMATGTGSTVLNWMTEGGEIVAGGVRYSIKREGLWSGSWIVSSGAGTVAEAHKQSAFARTFTITHAGRIFTLQPRSAFTRAFDILENGWHVGTIDPVHMFTRRATMEASVDVPEVVQVFVFWLAALMWRRQANSNHSAAPATT